MSHQEEQVGDQFDVANEVFKLLCYHPETGDRKLAEERLLQAGQVVQSYVEQAETAAYYKGKHDQRHQEIGVSRWISVGEEHGYWDRAITWRKAPMLIAEAKKLKGVSE